jgi:hypothetical protein
MDRTLVAGDSMFLDDAAPPQLAILTSQTDLHMDDIFGTLVLHEDLSLATQRPGGGALRNSARGLYRTAPYHVPVKRDTDHPLGPELATETGVPPHEAASTNPATANPIFAATTLTLAKTAPTPAMPADEPAGALVTAFLEASEHVLDDDDLSETFEVPSPIPKPRGDAARPGAGGYKVEDEMGWDKPSFEILKVCTLWCYI